MIFQLFSKVRRSVSDLNLVFNPDVIVTDFEVAVIEATRQQFPQARQVDCFFPLWTSHLAQGTGPRARSTVQERRWTTALHQESHCFSIFAYWVRYVFCSEFAYQISQ
jgi:hypothetical protein